MPQALGRALAVRARRVLRAVRWGKALDPTDVLLSTDEAALALTDADVLAEEERVGAWTTGREGGGEGMPRDQELGFASAAPSTRHPPPLVVARRLRMRYPGGDRLAVKTVSFGVPEGEVGNKTCFTGIDWKIARDSCLPMSLNSAH